MGQKRFCPIELLIIVIFTAIIMAVLVPNYASYQDGRRNQAVLAEAFSLQSAVEEYFLLYRHYPSDMSELVKENLLLADGLENHFTGNRSLPKIDKANPELGELVYQALDADKDGYFETYSIIAYVKQYQEVVPLVCLRYN